MPPPIMTTTPMGIIIQSSGTTYPMYRPPIPNTMIRIPASIALAESVACDINCSISYYRINYFYLIAFIILNHNRSLKAKIALMWATIVARSIKIYRFFTTKNLSDVFKILQNKKDGQLTNQYPKILNVQKITDGIHVSLQIKKLILGSFEVLFYEVTIKSNGVIFVQGKTAGRTDVNKFLAEIIESASRYDVIKEYVLTNAEMLQLFKNITKENNDNVILELKVAFNPELGHKHEDKEIYYKLSFQFIANKCASKHKNFDEFLKDSMEVEMQFGLLQCAGLEKESRKYHSKLIAKSDCSFRMYREVPHEDWMEFIEKVLTFI